MRRTLLLGVLIALASDPAAQQASYTYIPQPRGGSTSLTALNLPRLGTTFRLQVPTGLGNQVGPCAIAERVWLLTGSSNPALDLRSFGIASVLYSSMEIVTPLPMTFPSQTLIVIDYPIPNDARLLGVTFYQQLAISSFHDCMHTSSWMSLSHGGRGMVGH